MIPARNGVPLNSTFLQPALRPAPYLSSYSRPSAPPRKMRPVLQVSQIPGIAWAMVSDHVEPGTSWS